MIPGFIELDSPAKVNLMLSVHGPRDDGFHALTSLVVALDFGDRLKIEIASDQADALSCSDPAVPVGMSNLVLKAAAAFRAFSAKAVYFKFYLEKHIPMGAGLGGGSSNASTALLGMNALLGEPLNQRELMEIAAQLGSDCPFFIDPRPSIMKGRGERIEPLDSESAAVLRGRALVLFCPDFRVETAWAYQQLRECAPQGYESEEIANERLNAFKDSRSVESLLFNSFQQIVGRKYLALPTLLNDLDQKEVLSLMSGSGSCCFSILKESGVSSSQLNEICRYRWGDSLFWVETLII